MPCALSKSWLLAGHEFDFRWPRRRSRPDRATDRSPITNCQLNNTRTWAHGHLLTVVGALRLGRSVSPQPVSVVSAAERKQYIALSCLRICINWLTFIGDLSQCGWLAHVRLHRTIAFSRNILDLLSKKQRVKEKVFVHLLAIQMHKLHVHRVNGSENVGASLDDAFASFGHCDGCAGREEDWLISTAQWQIADKVALD